MRSSVRLGSGPGFTLDAVTCADDHRRWSGAEVGDAHRVVLVRRGRFRRMADGRVADLDPAMAYAGLPGQEEHFAHPAGGDVCTALTVSPGLWRTLSGSRPVRAQLYVDAPLDLAHRRLLRAARAGDTPFALTEALLGLVAATLTGAPGEMTAGTATAVVRRAREAIAAGHPAAGGLMPLAALLGVSPFQLSRAFTGVLGVSLTHYRNRVRVGRVLDRLEQGERSLAALAADLGFADQAHLTRTVRGHLGHTPAALRRLLAPERSTT
ncbi:helix-turn-helix domain-containing protein [Nonomuraea typhae]|uniref:helix-turn-helix domain-containing protein n=1 Tax=Nonomuraea typhae TaxID=2603600 RepID=UPI0012FBC4F7|nr:AraC family transcriptional regulator [Nonomuraea typhae]